MTICPHCGHGDDRKPASNARRVISLDVPEEHWALFRQLFSDMNTKLGMYGYGALANELPAYRDHFKDRYDDIFRYFDDAKIALVSIAVTRGARGKFRAVESVKWADRMNVFVELTNPDGKVLEISVSDAATPEAVEKFGAWFEDFQERLAPNPDDLDIRA